MKALIVTSIHFSAFNKYTSDISLVFLAAFIEYITANTPVIGNIKRQKRDIIICKLEYLFLLIIIIRLTANHS